MHQLPRLARAAYRLRQECARLAAGLFGDFPLSEGEKWWRRDAEFLSDYRRLVPNNPYSQDRKYALREFLRFVRNVPGELAECGCYQGASAYFIAKEFPEVPLHVFDSFKGLSPLAPEDHDGKGSPWRAGDFAASEAEFLKAVADFPRVRTYKGWIPDRFPEVADRRFRFVHVDVDLYRPIADCLEFFYPRLNPGGVIVLDDYGFTSCPGARKAVDEFMAGKPEHLLHLPTGQGILIKSGAPA